MLYALTLRMSKGLKITYDFLNIMDNTMKYSPPIPEISATMVAYAVASITERFHSVGGEAGGKSVVFDTKKPRFPQGLLPAFAPFYATVEEDAGNYKITFHREKPNNVTEKELNRVMLEIVAPEIVPKLTEAVQSRRK